MGIFRFLLKESPGRLLIISLIGFISGICSAALIAVINSSLQGGRIGSVGLGLCFLALVAGKILASSSSQQLLYMWSQRTILGLALNLSKHLARSSLRQAETLGSARMMGVLVDDIQVLGGAIQAVPTLAVNVSVLLGCSIYLIWLSWKAFLVLVLVACVGVFVYRSMLKETQGSLKLVREKRDTLFQQLRGLTEGLKELRINRSRRDDFFNNHVSKTIHDLNTHGLAAIRRYVLTDALSQFVFYGIIGLLVFAIPSVSKLPVSTLTGYVFAALYIMGPIWGLIYSLPGLQRGQIALESIETFKSSLVAEPDSLYPAALTDLHWDFLRMRDVVFSYDDAVGTREQFILGPLNFELKPGELVFVIGGNGCGKSTFVKLLCGLYTPKSGEIFLNDEAIRTENRDRYRQHFSVVFSDFFLFDSVLNASEPLQAQRVQEYLIKLQLDKKVTLEEGRFSTTALSQGQRRRLALLTAYLEDRPIYIFDEWAADQDPAYKEVFYKVLLPELRSKGKAVIVVTHDDRYFGLGDRVVRLDYGKATEVQYYRTDYSQTVMTTDFAAER